MNVPVKSRIGKARIIANTGYLKKYFGQECNAIFYTDYNGESVNPQLNTEQLTPPLQKWQSCNLADVEEIS